MSVYLSVEDIPNSTVFDRSDIRPKKFYKTAQGKIVQFRDTDQGFTPVEIDPTHPSFTLPPNHFFWSYA